MKRIKSGGRTKGTPNKLNQELRETLKSLIDAEIESVTPHLESLPLKDRLDFITKVLPYLVPKLESSTINDITPQTEPPRIVFTSSQVDKLIDKL